MHTESAPPPQLLYATPEAHRLATALEWDQLVRFAEREARTVPAKSLILLLADSGAWAKSPTDAKLRQQETSETLPLLDRDALWGPLTGLEDPALTLERLGRDAVLEVRDLALLRSWLYAQDSWAQVPREDIKGDRFRKMLAALPDPRDPLRTLERVLTPEGELSERASPRLASLHQDIRVTRKEIGSLLDHLLKTFSQKGVLQENFTDVRDGRYVIPVKISHQNEVEGIIYEASASRQTVFVEPKEVSPLNNKLRRLQNDLLQEIFVVLEDTSKKLKPFGREIADSVEVLTHWDAVQARARLGRHYSGKPIEIAPDDSGGRAFRLEGTAHPLLWWSMPATQIVRNTIRFGYIDESKRKRGEPAPTPALTLLLTGPNTGGKTVLLKTLGMAGLCARTGFPFPAEEIPQVPFFDSFFADLGDIQSIASQLSSFSGHVLRFKEILDHVTDRSLVLLDELNTATDPEEGAALGRAFLETVMERGAMIVSTTHDPQLKALSLTDGRILTASLAFDETSRTPTYRIVIGVPGRSRALETAERLGIPAPILELARRYLSKEHQVFENLLSKLESDVAEAARAKNLAVASLEEAEKLKHEWTERTRASVNEMLDRTRIKLRRILEQAQDEVRASVKKLDEMRTRRELDQTRAGISEVFQSSAEAIEAALTSEAPSLARELEATRVKVAAAAKPELEKGARVKVPKWKATGTVLEVDGNRIKVAMGTMQMWLTFEDIEVILAARGAPSASKMVDQDRPAAPASQIDLRGVRYDVAMSQLVQYLDQAFRSGAYAEITIVHGLGTGAIREGARKLLGDLPYVKSFHDGGAGRGGAGATVVTFDPS